MKKSLSISLLTTIVLIQGCGKGAPEPPMAVATVEGHVTYKGQPVADADVTFYNSEANKSSFGRTDKDGYYRLSTFSANDGAVPGSQKVMVTKYEPVPADPTVADMDSPNYVPPAEENPRKPVKPVLPKALVPEKYGQQASSPLIAMVEKEKKNKFDFSLDD